MAATLITAVCEILRVEEATSAVRTWQAFRAAVSVTCDDRDKDARRRRCGPPSVPRSLQWAAINAGGRRPRSVAGHRLCQGPSACGAGSGFGRRRDQAAVGVVLVGLTLGSAKTSRLLAPKTPICQNS